MDLNVRPIHHRLPDRVRAHVMPFGSPVEVEEVQKTFEVCGTPDGGLIACGELGPDVPFENIGAMYQAFRKFGGCGGEKRGREI